MSYGEDSWSIVKSIRCPKCMGPMETIIKKPLMLLVYAKCEENNCQLRQDQLVAIRAKSIQKMEEEG